MKSFSRFTTLGIIVALVLSACNLRPTPTAVVPVLPAFSGSFSQVGLSVQAVVVGSEIRYTYTVTNTADPALALPVTVTNDKTTTVPTCAIENPGSGTTPNNGSLERSETVTCTSSYTIAQGELGPVTSNATARVGNIDSNRVTTVVPLPSTQNKVLTVTVTPNPLTYSAAGQTITYTYVIGNTGPPLVVAQFVVRDDRAGTINCNVNKTLNTGELWTCLEKGTYVTQQSDTSAAKITNAATASGGNAETIQPGTGTVTNTNVTSQVPPPSGLTIGATIQHTVVKGEWLIQIARCYGADYNEVRSANPHILVPAFITPGMTVTVRNIGSKGKIYGLPCIGFHTYQSGDTWNSIAQKYNADILVLQEANLNVSLANGACIRIPMNSAGGTSAAAPTGTCGIGTTNPLPTPPIRITIPTSPLPGTVLASGKVRYVFNATKDQILTVKLLNLNVPANEVTLGITASNGSIMKAQDGTLTFTGTIPSTGDSFIDIFAVSGASSKTYTLEVTLTTPAAVSPFERAADIKPGADSSTPAYLTVFNGALYFQATGNDAAGQPAGAELWKYESNTASLVKDIVLGPVGSDPAYLAAYNTAPLPTNNGLYFRANGQDNFGAELWRYIGANTGRLTDINSNAGDANPSYPVVLGTMLYFSAFNSANGAELWKTDGGNPVLAADINAGSGDSNPAYLTVLNGILYFSAVSTDGAGVELYKFDQSQPPAPGTNPVRVTDINVGVGNSNPAHLAVFKNAIYFSANDGTTGVELWKYDPSANPTTTRVADIVVGAGDFAPAFLTEFKSELYFSANGNDGFGIELWKYDGINPPKRVSDLNTAAGNSSPSYLVVFNNELYFQANGNDGAGTELWKYKGP